MEPFNAAGLFDLARGKPVTASSEFTSYQHSKLHNQIERKASCMVDGNGETRWSANKDLIRNKKDRAFLQEIEIDLQNICKVSQVAVQFYDKAWASRAQLHLAKTRDDWTQLVEVKENTKKTVFFQLNQVKNARYVKLVLIERGNVDNGYSIHRLEVHGVENSQGDCAPRQGKIRVSDLGLATVSWVQPVVGNLSHSLGSLLQPFRRSSEGGFSPDESAQHRPRRGSTIQLQGTSSTAHVLHLPHLTQDTVDTRPKFKKTSFAGDLIRSGLGRQSVCEEATQVVQEAPGRMASQPIEEEGSDSHRTSALARFRAAVKQVQHLKQFGMFYTGEIREDAICNLQKAEEDLGQVGGHALVFVKLKGGRLAKLAEPRELETYEQMHKNWPSEFMPQFFGQAELSGKPCIILEDLTFGMNKPCVLDIKMGNTTYETNASLLKQMKLGLVDSVSITAKQGLRVVGMSVFLPTSDSMRKVSKRDALLKYDDIKMALIDFFDNGSEQSFAQVWHVVLTIAIKVGQLLQHFKLQRKFRFTGSSLLLLYDGAPDTGTDNRGKVDIRMIDFAHVNKIEAGDESGDDGYIMGLESLQLALNLIMEQLQTMPIATPDQVTVSDSS